MWHNNVVFYGTLNEAEGAAKAANRDSPRGYKVYKLVEA